MFVSLKLRDSWQWVKLMNQSAAYLFPWPLILLRFVIFCFLHDGVGESIIFLHRQVAPKRETLGSAVMISTVITSFNDYVDSISIIKAPVCGLVEVEQKNSNILKQVVRKS